jgi:hypothetical protein
MAGDALVLKFRGVEIDVPRSVGFYGGVAAAVATGVIEAPLGVLIASMPLVKMALNSRAPAPLHWIGQVFDGAIKPVGGDGQGTIRLDDPEEATLQAAQSVATASKASARTKAQARKQAAASTR